MLPYHVLPVYGNASLGYYYVNIYVGSPEPQPQSVIIDTGSGILAMPCANCQSCGVKNHINPPYDFKKSPSSNVLTCVINILYRQVKIPYVLINVDLRSKPKLVHLQFITHRAAHCQVVLSKMISDLKILEVTNK